MSSKAGVRLEIANEQFKKNWKSILVATGKAMIMFCKEDKFGAMKEFLSVGTAITKEDKIETVALYFVTEALEKGAYELIGEYKSLYKSDLSDPRSLEKEKIYVEFLNGVTTLTKNKEIYIDQKFMQAPRSFSILLSFQRFLKNWIVLFGIKPESAAEITDRFPSYFVRALYHAYSKNYEQCRRLSQHLNHDLTAAMEREMEQIAYREYLKHQTSKSILNEPYSFKDLYIEPRAYSYEKPFINTLENKKPKHQSFSKQIFLLQKQLNEWLYTTKNQGAIKVISGNLGSGKTLFAKSWAAEVAKREKFQTLFIPMNELEYQSTTNLKNIIENYIKGTPDLPLNHNVLNHPNPEDLILLVFDGLEKIVLQNKTSQESAVSFIKQMMTLCNQVNKRKERLKIVVTCYPVMAAHIETELKKASGQIYHLLPFLLTQNALTQSTGLKELLEEDQIILWWDKYLKKTNSNNGLPKPFPLALKEITANPLINHQLALFHKQHKINDNINLTYCALIREIHNRRRNESLHTYLSAYNEDDYLYLLEHIAVAIWQHEGSATIDEILKYLQVNNYDTKNKTSINYAKGTYSTQRDCIFQILNSFYFETKSSQDRTKKTSYQFTYKLLENYLVARFLVNFLAQAHKKVTDNKYSTNNKKQHHSEISLEEWLKVVRRGVISSDLQKFVKQEFQLRVAQNNYEVKKWQGTLCKFIETAVRQGIIIEKERAPFLEEQRQARNTSEILMLLLSACNDAINPNETVYINWGNRENFSGWVHRLRRDTNSQNISRLYFQYLNIENADLSYSHFENTNFKMTNLSNSNLSHARFVGANFYNAILFEADCEHANFENANFKYADLRHADLNGANLRHADFQHADLRHVEGLSFEQLSLTKDLSNVKGLSEILDKKLRREYSHLFLNEH